MALSECVIAIDPSGRELVPHGSTAFPIACYHDDFKQQDVPWHWHEEFEVALITEGYATVSTDKSKYIIHSGEGFFINSGIIHGAWDYDFTGCKFHSIVFHPRLVGGDIDSIFHQKYIQPLIHTVTLESLHFTPEIEWQKNVLQMIENAWQTCTAEEPGYEFLVRSQLSSILLLIYNNLPSVLPDITPKTARNSARIKKMMQYIHENYSEELNVQQIAASASISESECLRCFKTTIGITPIQYVRQHRIHRACQFLETTDTTIADIAILCGFQDFSYFIKTFREARGVTPGEYRKLSFKK